MYRLLLLLLLSNQPCPTAHDPNEGIWGGADCPPHKHPLGQQVQGAQTHNPDPHRETISPEDAQQADRYSTDPPRVAKPDVPACCVGREVAKPAEPVCGWQSCPGYVQPTPCNLQICPEFGALQREVDDLRTKQPPKDVSVPEFVTPHQFNELSKQVQILQQKMEGLLRMVGVLREKLNESSGPTYYEHSINKGAPYLLKSINVDTVAPQGEKDKCECGQSKGPIAVIPNAKLAPTVDSSTPHTTTVRCGENGIFGVLINNELHTVQVTCYEGKNHQK